MTARRRRGGSESEQTPLIIVPQESPAARDPWQSHRPVNISGNNGGAIPRYYREDTINPSFSGTESVLGSVRMTSRDRTMEFVNTVRSLQSREIARVVSVRDSRKSKHLQDYAEFMMIARTIGKNISSAYAKLEKLAGLARNTSIYSDQPTEIQELTVIIKEDLSSLNQQIARLQEVSRGQRSTSQTNGRHLMSHSSSVVLALQSKLASMSTAFKQVLEVRTENLRHQKSRQDFFSKGPVSTSLPPMAVSGYHQGSVLLKDESQVAINMEGGGGSRGPPGTMPGHSLQTQVQAYDQTDDYIQSRAETMQNIESTIVELGGIFQQLANMVKEQEELVERIDTNVQDASLNVEAAHGEILKYFQSVTSNRWLMIKIFAILIFFFIFFIIFLA
ncbi:syntaxin-5 [Ischnura elegans]|uniref:syntaxin-5 n=1 Tax=Ischnura elegans TaxID=197161 RepID=UPI001ED8789E|nr:syntaxin-5 [Ischnura elegans]